VVSVPLGRRELKEAGMLGALVVPGLVAVLVGPFVVARLFFGLGDPS
jgi:hypothetical protein